MQTRQLPPATRYSLPIWEITEGTEVLGWVKQKRLKSASAPFFEAVILHPVDEQHYSLELSANFDERVETVLAFHRDPPAFNHHLPPEAKINPAP
jgi:hypothetical protein